MEGIDAQLEAANRLLAWLRSHEARKYGARAHPAICAARDQYGGLCLVVAHSPASSSRHRQVNDAQNDRHPESRLRKSRRKQGRRAGIAADEELLAIPRCLMLEPLSPVEWSDTALLPANLPEDMPQAALAVALLQKYKQQQEQQGEQDSSQGSCHCAPKRADLATCAASIPAAVDLACKFTDGFKGLAARQTQLQDDHLPPGYMEYLPSRSAMCDALPVLAHLCQLQQLHEQGLPKRDKVEGSDTDSAGPLTTVATLLAPSAAASSALANHAERLQREWQAVRGWQGVNWDQGVKDGEADISDKDGVGQHGHCSCGGRPAPEQYHAEAKRAQGEYLWARGIVMSRAIHLWGGPTLVPGLDLLNHGCPPNVYCMVRSEDIDDCLMHQPEEESSSEGSWGGDSSCSDSSSNGSDNSDVPFGVVTRYSHAEQRQMFVCRAIRPLPPGTQALWAYNSHTHDAGWLMSYGFVPDKGQSSKPDPVKSSQATNASYGAALEQLNSACGCGLISAGLGAAFRTFLTREKALQPGG